MTFDQAAFDAGLDAYQATLAEEAAEASLRSWVTAARPEASPAEVTFGDLRLGDYMTNEGPDGRWVKIVDLRGPSCSAKHGQQHGDLGDVDVLFEIPEAVTVSGERRYWILRPATEPVLIDLAARTATERSTPMKIRLVMGRNCDAVYVTCPDCGGTGQRATALTANGAELERHERDGTPCDSEFCKDGLVQLDAGPSLRLFNHSPDGFAWGYGGSGPAQLALALLLAACIDDEQAVRLHQDFKNEFVACWPQEDGEYEVDVKGWALRHPAYTPTVDEALHDPEGFVAGMKEVH